MAPPGKLSGSSSSVARALADWAKRHPTSAVAVPSSRGLVVVALREAIVSGDIPAGQQLKQDELAAYFRVSPGPVREALRQLESEGLVRHQPNRGMFVTELPADEALEVLLPVRLLLEDYALKCVASELSDQLVAQLGHQIEIMEHGAREADVAMINEADVRFHELAVGASRAYHVIQLWQSVLPRIRRQFYVLTPRHTDLQDVAEEHRILLSALQSGDSSRLSATLFEHIVGVSRALMKEQLENTEPSGGPCVAVV